MHQQQISTSIASNNKNNSGFSLQSVDYTKQNNNSVNEFNTSIDDAVFLSLIDEEPLIAAAGTTSNQQLSKPVQHQQATLQTNQQQRKTSMPKIQPKATVPPAKPQQNYAFTAKRPEIPIKKEPVADSRSNRSARNGNAILDIGAEEDSSWLFEAFLNEPNQFGLPKSEQDSSNKNYIEKNSASTDKCSDLTTAQIVPKTDPNAKNSFSEPHAANVSEKISVARRNENNHRGINVNENTNVVSSISLDDNIASSMMSSSDAAIVSHLIQIESERGTCLFFWLFLQQRIF